MSDRDTVTQPLASIVEALGGIAALEAHAPTCAIYDDVNPEGWPCDCGIEKRVAARQAAAIWEAIQAATASEQDTLEEARAAALRVLQRHAGLQNPSSL